MNLYFTGIKYYLDCPSSYHYHSSYSCRDTKQSRLSPWNLKRLHDDLVQVGCLVPFPFHAPPKAIVFHPLVKFSAKGEAMMTPL